MKKLELMLILLLALIQTYPAFALENSQKSPLESGQSPKKVKEAQAVFDPDAPAPLTLRITDQLSFGAKLNLDLEGKDNEDLTDEKSDGLASLRLSLSPAMLYQPLVNIDLFAEGRLTQRSPLIDSADQTDERTELNLKRGYVRWRDFLIPSVDIQVGRQRFIDRREWLYDENLDAARIVFDRNPFSLELSASTTRLINPEDPEDRIRNYILYVTYSYGEENKISFYEILRRDSSKEDFNPTFFGISWRDRSIKRQEFWLDSALVLGHEKSKRLRGFGVDVGWISRFDYPMKPSSTIGFAYGSGDSDPETGVDRNFRQTGLHDNKGRFTGNTKFKYYGEVFDPELSNMMIWTTGLGIRPFEKTSLDVVYHYYAQAQKAIEIREVDIDVEPFGKSRNLGQEVDTILGVRIKKNFRFALITGVFIPGNAFREGDSVLFGELKFEFDF